MKNDVLQEAEEYAKVRRRRNRRNKIVMILAALVVFCTTYALILPAITMEKTTCSMQEHVHTEACYTPAALITKQVPVCSPERLNIHRHGQSCYDRNGNLICGYADFVVHRHNASCYNEDGSLWCALPEIECHTHDAGCYTAGSAAHIHGPECYATERGNLICGQHEHTEECYADVNTSDSISKDISLFDDGDAFSDGEAGWSDGQTDTSWESSPVASRQLICGYAGDHHHTDSCYEQRQVLICGFDSETDVFNDSAGITSQLICGKEEIILHEHTDACTDANGNLICGKRQVLEHVHSDACFETVEVPEGELSLSCGMEQHVHGVDCNAAPENEENEPAEDTEATPAPEYEENEPAEDTEATPTPGNEENVPVEDTEVTPVPASEDVELAEPEETAEEETDIIPDGGDAEGEPAETEDIEDIEENAAEEEEEESEVFSEEDEEESLEEADVYPMADEEEGLSSLTDDSAQVYELTWKESFIISEEDLEFRKQGAVRNHEKIAYSFLVKTASYTEESFGEGRVRLEFVLPLTSAEASFDLESMKWLDTSSGYEPVVNTEKRLVGGEEVLCQVLTGYKLLKAGEEETVIPGEFTESAVISIDDAAPDTSFVLQISAAMEHNTWDGLCENHQTGEKRTVTSYAYTVTELLTDEELQEIYEKFLEEVERLEALGKLDEDTYSEAMNLLERIQEAYDQERLSQENYAELYNRVNVLLEGYTSSVAESAKGTNWMRLRDSGWFEEYAGSDFSTYSMKAAAMPMAAAEAGDMEAGSDAAASAPSDVQVHDRGGEKKAEEDGVSVSKTIEGTDLENVFDITLQVQTSHKIEEITQEPDMAVVIVMDISNTMNSNFGGVTRYAAAMESAEQFLDSFAASNTLGVSKVGYVAFNTNAKQIFGLQSCSTQEQANALKNTMRLKTGDIINNYEKDNTGFVSDHSRFTNVEAGLAMASDMLNGVSNQNKYIIFLSDGFPTTYISSGYSGYDPYDSTGRFYDHVLNKNCLYGTSYSDEAAIRARKKAAAIKGTGTTIFSIGVDVAGQTIQQYITQSEKAKGHSVVDRTGTTYEIGDASSTEAYKNWLRNSIGSGYYYDSTDSAGLSSAYQQIFAEIKHKSEEGSKADWVANDPIPTVSGSAENVEFIGFYGKTPELVEGSLTGSHAEREENTASFDPASNAISWDLKNSGYQSTTSGDTTLYTYQLVYRVRLKNENRVFTEGTIYPTNDTTTLQYRTISGTDGNLTVSDSKTIEFPIPSVHGYLAELTFRKVDNRGYNLAGAEFTLHHDEVSCNHCRGDGKTSVAIADQIAVSGSDGNVSFTKIPSGHKYTLTETKVPEGYASNGNKYTVEIAYDKVTVTVTTFNGENGQWNNEIENRTYYELPSTGGKGFWRYTMIGVVMLLTAVGILIWYNDKKRGKEDHASH